MDSSKPVRLFIRDRRALVPLAATTAQIADLSRHTARLPGPEDAIAAPGRTRWVRASLLTSPDTARLDMPVVMPIAAWVGRASSRARPATQAAHQHPGSDTGVDDLEWAVEWRQGGLQESNLVAASAAELFEGERA
jgi:hypothetical protein